MKPENEEKNVETSMTTRYIVSGITVLIAGFVFFDIYNKIPLETRQEAWRQINAFANTWPGIFVITILSIPIFATVVITIIKLLEKFMDRVENKK